MARGEAGRSCQVTGGTHAVDLGAENPTQICCSLVGGGEGRSQQDPASSCSPRL